MVPPSSRRKLQGRDLTDDLERATMEMLYRHQIEFVVGHGVGVHAEVSKESLNGPRWSNRRLFRPTKSPSPRPPPPPTPSRIPPLPCSTAWFST